MSRRGDQKSGTRRKCLESNFIGKTTLGTIVHNNGWVPIDDLTKRQASLTKRGPSPAPTGTWAVVVVGGREKRWPARLVGKHRTENEHAPSNDGLLARR